VDGSDIASLISPASLRKWQKSDRLSRPEELASDGEGDGHKLLKVSSATGLVAIEVMERRLRLTGLVNGLEELGDLSRRAMALENKTSIDFGTANGLGAVLGRRRFAGTVMTVLVSSESLSDITYTQ
jgi:hypothetical protein